MYVLAIYFKMQYIANTFTEPRGKLLEMSLKNLIIMANNQVFLSDDSNDLNQLLSTFVDSEHEIKNFCSSQYIDLSDLSSILKNDDDFAILTLNVQSINAKFDNLFAIINNLSNSGHFFGAICLQETWLTGNADLSLLQIPGYKLIHQGRKCTRHGGLIIYLSETYSYKTRNMYPDSDAWEGQFIDVEGGNLRRTLTLGNIYRPPHHNNNNESISKFIAELSPIIEALQKENTYASLVGDFNINLLQINEREIYEEYLDLMCTNNFYPKISLPTRYSKNSCSLIDQMFCKVPLKEDIEFSSSIIVSRISDHFPCIANLKILKRDTKHPKFTHARPMNDHAIQRFKDDLANSCISSVLNPKFMTDPNTEFEKFEKIVSSYFDKHFPEKTIKVNKYRHKLSKWITSGIIKSIEFRDKLYKRLKTCGHNNPEYERLKHNLKVYNGYLHRCIRTAKKEYYANEFLKYKNDIRKTWDTLKDILNKKKSKKDFPSYFLDNGTVVTGAINIANKFNEYFTNIGPQLARSIDGKNRIPFHSYLTKPCSSSFGFQYTNPTDVSKIINKMKPKSSAGYDNISSKLLIQIGDIIACPLSIIINQSLCTGIFPKKLKLAKVIPLYKKDDEKSFGNYRPISLLSSFSKIFERIVFNQLYDYLIEHDLLYQSQYGFRRFHSTELAALELTDRIRQQIDQKKVPFSVFLDLSMVRTGLEKSWNLTLDLKSHWILCTLQIKTSAVSVFLEANHHSIITHFITLDKKTIK